MRKVAIAEWLLSLLVQKDAAASIAGDLAEDAAARGGTWFWTSVAGTLARQTCQRTVRMPAAALFLVGISWFTYMGFGLGFLLASVVLARPAAFVTNLLVDHTGVGLILSSVDAATVRVVLQQASLWVITPLLVGSRIARRVPGFELPMALAASACWLLLSTLIPFVGRGVRASDGIALVIVCLIAGAVRERRAAQAA